MPTATGYTTSWSTDVDALADTLQSQATAGRTVHALQMLWRTSGAVVSPADLESEVTWMSIVEAVATTRDDLVALGGSFARLDLGAGPTPLQPLTDTAELRAAIRRLLLAVVVALRGLTLSVSEPETAFALAATAVQLERSIPHR
jgi:hypothetical protein